MKSSNYTMWYIPILALIGQSRQINGTTDHTTSWTGGLGVLHCKANWFLSMTFHNYTTLYSFIPWHCVVNFWTIFFSLKRWQRIRRINFQEKFAMFEGVQQLPKDDQLFVITLWDPKRLANMFYSIDLIVSLLYQNLPI